MNEFQDWIASMSSSCGKVLQAVEAKHSLFAVFQSSTDKAILAYKPLRPTDWGRIGFGCEFLNLRSKVEQPIPLGFTTALHTDGHVELSVPVAHDYEGLIKFYLRIGTERPVTATINWTKPKP